MKQLCPYGNGVPHLLKIDQKPTRQLKDSDKIEQIATSISAPPIVLITQTCPPSNFYIIPYLKRLFLEKRFYSNDFKTMRASSTWTNTKTNIDTLEERDS